MEILYRMTHELLGQLAARKETFAQNPVSVEQMGELIDLVQNRSITGNYLFTELSTLN
jgi:aspartyl-tRNA(Asn)/glutamyl-tRNA(Gln) amidotransferase subunit B